MSCSCEIPRYWFGLIVENATFGEPFRQLSETMSEARLMSHHASIFVSRDFMRKHA